MTDPTCFTCGHRLPENPFENRLADGKACPTCRDRLLDGAPALLPRLDSNEAEEADASDPAISQDDDDPIGA